MELEELVSLLASSFFCLVCSNGKGYCNCALDIPTDLRDHPPLKYIRLAEIYEVEPIFADHSRFFIGINGCASAPNVRGAKHLSRYDGESTAAQGHRLVSCCRSPHLDWAGLSYQYYYTAPKSTSAAVSIGGGSVSVRYLVRWTFIVCGSPWHRLEFSTARHLVRRPRGRSPAVLDFRAEAYSDWWHNWCTSACQRCYKCPGLG
jgi:hypothetical protein